MSKTQILQEFKAGINCSQLVLGQWSEELGYEREECLRMAAPFGGGCFRGDTCGAVAGAMLTIGMRYGHCAAGDTAGSAAMQEKVTRFQTQFIGRCGSLICRELTGYDFSVPGQFRQASDAGILFERCPGYVNAALEILDEIM